MQRPKKPTRALAMLAKCHSCLAAYADGIRDCEGISCPLYPWMIRAKLEPDLWWMAYNPRKKGHVLWEDCGKEMTEEQKNAARERLAQAREQTNQKRQDDLDDWMKGIHPKEKKKSTEQIARDKLKRQLDF